jgi:GTP-binding protein
MTATSFTPAELAAGEALFRRPWHFLKSVPDLDGLPEAERPEICFAGRSNVGKSSLINKLVGRALARTSNTPGRTQELNFYAAPAISLFLVDLPGYGFAAAPKERVAAWTRLVRDYLRGRARLVRAFLLIDVRRGLTPPDLEIMHRMDAAAVSYQGVLTKIDQVKPTQLKRVVAATEDALGRHSAAVGGIFATSAATGAGLAELKAHIATLAAASGAGSN